jgi:RNA polymerase sigma-70 factor, ECF subfamily
VGLFGKAKSNQLKQWLDRMRAGDQSAFLPLYEKTAPSVLRFLLWKTNGDKPLAEDIMQDAYVKFLLSIDKLESDQDLAVQAYLLRIAKNCLIDKAARGPRATKQHLPLDEIMELPDTMASAQQERAVEMRELSVAMQALSEKDSEIIWLRDGLGLSHREVAEEIGITEQASRQAYVRAKRSLLAEFAEKLNPVPSLGDSYVVPEMS